MSKLTYVHTYIYMYIHICICRYVLACTCFLTVFIWFMSTFENNEKLIKIMEQSNGFGVYSNDILTVINMTIRHRVECECGGSTYINKIKLIYIYNFAYIYVCA